MARGGWNGRLSGGSDSDDPAWEQFKADNPKITVGNLRDYCVHGKISSGTVREVTHPDGRTETEYKPDGASEYRPLNYYERIQQK